MPDSIGARLAAVRRSAGLSQTELADRVGLSRNQLATIERGIVPLRYGAGWEMCRELNLSQVWLITGMGSKTPFLEVELGLSEDCIDEHWEFEEVCTHVLGDRLNDRSREVSAFREAYKDVPSLSEPMDEIAIKWRENKIQRLRRQARSMTLEADRLEGAIKLAQASNRGEQSQPPISEKQVLTNTSTCAKLPSVKSRGNTHLDNLLDGLERLVKEPGKKTELAKYLGAPLASVSRWLGNKREPGREITLEMLRWVELEERQQETPGSTSNTAKGKTQVRKSGDEKQTQVRKKKG